VSRLYAWAHAISPDEAVDAAARFPGLGLVLYGTNYAAVMDLDVPPIAYVGSIAQAEGVAALARSGYRWHAAIVNDERNQTGPSGAYWAPEQYREVFASIAPILRDAGVPVSTMGLAPKRTLLWDTLRARRFDDWYHSRLPESDLRAFNPNGVRRREIERALRKGERWILSPAPFRSWWDNLLSPVKVGGWARYANDDRVHAVALWCLREVKEGGGRWQKEHGLLDRHDRLTRIGRQVKRHLT
jgi:hypothetical protein